MNSTKKGKKYRGVIYPRSGSPFEVDVESDEKGMVHHDGKTWEIVPGSVFTSNSVKRVILPEALPHSLNSAVLEGKTPMTARQFFLFMKMNLLEQLFKLQSKTPWFKQSSTWIIAGSIMGLILAVWWVGSSIGGGLDELRNTLEGLDLSNGSSQGNATSHQQLERRR